MSLCPSFYFTIKSVPVSSFLLTQEVGKHMPTLYTSNLCKIVDDVEGLAAADAENLEILCSWNGILNVLNVLHLNLGSGTTDMV